jgi:hypothetical protein
MCRSIKTYKEGIMSSVSGISSYNNSYQNVLQSNWKQRKQDFEDMITAIQSSDLAGAQKALAAFQSTYTQSVSQVDNGEQQSNQNSPILTDYNSLANALSSGDLTGAQQAFTSLLQDIQNMQNAGQVHHHHHHHHHYAQNATASTGSNGSTSTTDGTTSSSISTTV